MIDTLKNNPFGITFSATVIGATGLVGKHLVNELINDVNCIELRIIVRRKTHFNHPKIVERIIDFDFEEDYLKNINGDVLFSCLGATRAQARSIKNHYLVDYIYQLRAARAAHKNGVKSYILLSSPFADIQAKNYYGKMKAELEEAVIKLDFQKIIILKPNGIMGKRKGIRNWENIAAILFTPLIQLLLPKYRPIHARDLAKSMLRSYHKKSRQHITYLIRNMVNFT